MINGSPSGNTSQAAQAFYLWLWQQYHASFPLDRTHILWTGPFWIFFWLIMLVGFFFVYARFFNRVHRKKGELYGVMSFAGNILERIGPVGLFTYLFSAAFVIWSIYYMFVFIFNGMVY